MLGSNSSPSAPPSTLAANFVALAGAGTLAKSMAKGMGRPCFRVIQTHFSGRLSAGRAGLGATRGHFLPELPPLVLHTCCCCAREA